MEQWEVMQVVFMLIAHTYDDCEGLNDYLFSKTFERIVIWSIAILIEMQLQKIIIMNHTAKLMYYVQRND